MENRKKKIEKKRNTIICPATKDAIRLWLFSKGPPYHHEIYSVSPQDIIADANIAYSGGVLGTKPELCILCRLSDTTKLFHYTIRGISVYSVTKNEKFQNPYC